MGDIRRLRWACAMGANDGAGWMLGSPVRLVGASLEGIAALASSVLLSCHEGRLRLPGLRGGGFRWVVLRLVC